MQNKAGVWLRAAALSMVILGAAFILYGRLVNVETRLAALERQVTAIHDRLFTVAER